MLQQHHRFHGHGSLRFVYRQGSAVRSSLFTVKYIHNTHRTHNRFAVVVSKKIIKSAVRRNRLRRRLFEIIRHEIPLLKTHHDIAIIVISGEAYALDHRQLKTAVRRAFSEAHLYK